MPIALLLLALAPAAAQPPEIVAQIRVHGNVAIAAEEVLRLADVAVGAPFAGDTLAGVERRLRDSGRFRTVEVLKRYASIADPSQIAIVIIVDEGPVRIEWDPERGDARAVRRRGPTVMFLPVLAAEDGYGWTYGARFAVPGVAGARSRLAVPLTWGGDKRAGVQLEKDLARGPLDRITAGLARSRREHPFHREDDDRLRVWVRAERDLAAPLRAGVTVGSERVSFLGRDDRVVQTGADLELDTRVDPVLARNAVYVHAAWDRFRLDGSDAFHRYALDVRGYAGLAGQSVLVARVLRSAANRPLPAFLQPVLGGMDNLRGFRAGTAVGDTLAGAALELRTPITSPLSVGKIGVSAFVDAAAVYDHGGRLADQRIDRGVGGSVWLSAAFVRVNLSIARGIGGGTRAHFGTSLAF